MLEKVNPFLQPILAQIVPITGLGVGSMGMDSLPILITMEDWAYSSCRTLSANTGELSRGETRANHYTMSKVQS